MDAPAPSFRKIIHIDMDAYYASIEQRDFPEYRGKPIAVGGSPEGRGGVVATASYEARKFGVRSAMPSKHAARICPDLIFVKPRFDVYREISGSIRNIFNRYTDLIEPLSLDEAFLDVTEDKLGIGSAIEIAEQIRSAIKTELSLTASAGVSVNKFIAKIASDMRKPDGITFIGPSKIVAFVEGLPVEKFFGVGRVTAEKMKALGMHTGADIKAQSLATLTDKFGKSGKFFYNIVRGVDDRPVQPHRQRKSIGAEDTFPEDLLAVAPMEEMLERLSHLVANRLQEKDTRGKTITLKIKFSDFKQITRRETLSIATREQKQLLETSVRLLKQAVDDGQAVRLLGITVSNLDGTAVEPQQLRLL